MTLAIDFPTAARHRLPAWALGLSLAVHLAVLAGPLVQRRATEIDRPPLLVNLHLPPVLAAATASAPEMPRAAPLPPPVAVRQPAPRPAQLAVSERAAPSRVDRVTPPAAPEAVAAAPAVPPAPAAERHEAAPPARVAEARLPPDAGEQAAMARYIRLLGDLLASQQQYPRVAALRGWEGEVRLRLQVARKGAIIAVHIVQSSGFDVLDQHAVQLVHSATLPPPPATQSSGISGSAASPDLMIDVPINYALKRSS